MLLRINSLTKYFGDKKALDNVTFDVTPGHITGLLGPNGAGKTTLIRLLLGVFTPDSGTCLYNGKNKISPSSIGYVPEEHALYEKSTVKQNIYYFSRLRGLDRKSIDNCFDGWIEKFRLTQFINNYTETLSKGNRQKVQLLISLLHDPSVIIWDEPFSGLDPVAREYVTEIMREEASRGKVFLVSTHQLESAENFCDSIVMLNDGKLLVSGDVKSLKENYSSDIIEITTNAPASFFSDIPGIKNLTENKGIFIIETEKGFDKKSLFRLLNESYDIIKMSEKQTTVKEIFFSRISR